MSHFANLGATQRATATPFRMQVTAIAEHDLGHDAEAARVLEQLIDQYQQLAAYQIAEVYGWYGDKDATFHWLERAYAMGDGGLTMVKIDPFFDFLRSEPRFAAFLKKMNLPE